MRVSTTAFPALIFSPPALIISSKQLIGFRITPVAAFLERNSLSRFICGSFEADSIHGFLVSILRVRRTEKQQMSIPYFFRCPISLDLFTDPVTLSTGQTYDRPWIEKWFADGNLTCPVTMQRLRDASFVPNHTLRHLIDQWLITGAGGNSHRWTNNSELSLAKLKQDLQSSAPARPAKLKALKKVRVLSLESDIGRSCLIQLGFFPLLLQLLFQTPKTEDFELIEVALECVLSLSSRAQLDSLNVLKKSSGLDSLILLLDKGNIKIKANLCHLLEAIAASPVTLELSLIVGQTTQVLRALVSLTHDQPNQQASEAAVGAVAAICSLEANRGNAIREGAVDAIISYLLNSTRKSDSRALATLELLLGLEDGKRALVKNPNSIPILVKMVFVVSSDHKGSEHAVSSLLTMCHGSTRMMVKAADAGVLMQLLLLLQSQCSSKAKANARALLKMLRCLWDDDPGGDDLNRDK